MLPPGLFRLATRPTSTGSAPVLKTIGIVAVAALAASADATLPGVAIYQLSTRPGIDAVGVTRWIWNGRERALDASVVPGARAPAPEDTGGLAS